MGFFEVWSGSAPWVALLVAVSACSGGAGDATSGSGGGTSTSATGGGGAGGGGGAPNGCADASSGLAATADAQAPVLDPQTSNLQRVTSNDAFCASQKQGAHPTFGEYGYLLNVFLHDADGDGPTLDSLTSNAGVVRFGASPAFVVADKLDPAHGYSTQGEGFIVQLCLDEAYAPGALTLAVDVADAAGHRSKAICVTEAGGK